MTGLSDHDRLVVSRARQLAGIRGADDVRTYTGTNDTDTAYAEALGEAQHLLGELVDIAVLADEDARRLREVRGVLARFDWEHDDRQYALEAIERIVTEGGTDGS